MTKNFTIFLFIILLLVSKTNIVTAQVNTQDSLALVDLYNNLDGPNWKHHDNWLTAARVSTWYGITVTNNRVTKIALTFNRLTGVIPSSISNLTALNYLYLSVNKLTGEIPVSIGDLSNLIELALDNNYFTDTIPSSIGNLINLTKLKLFEDHQLTGNIPPELGNLIHLTDLELSFNHLKETIPASLGNLTQLKNFLLEFNQLKGSIPPELGNLVNVIDFELSFNRLTGSIPSSLGNLKKVGTIYLGNNQLTGSIPSSFNDLDSLSDLELWNNKLSDTIPFLNDLTNLIDLQLGSNKFTFAGMERIVKFFPKTGYSPQANIKLHLNGNILSVSAGGTLSHNTYTWYRYGQPYKYIMGDSTLTITIPGNYSAKITNSVADQLSLFTDTVDIRVLATNLLSFAATKQNNNVVLQWSATADINTKYFEIEKSMNGEDFLPVAKVDAKTGTIKNDYSFTDNSATAITTVPYLFYRLKILYNDGSADYSEIRSIQLTNNANLIIYPNPAKTITTLLFKAEGKYTIIITSSAGKILQTKTGVANNETNFIRFDVRNYTTGVYLVTIIDEKNKKQFVKLNKE